MIWQEADGSIIPPSIPLSSEHITDDGIYLLENGEDALIYVGNSVDTEILQQIFGAPSVDGISTQVQHHVLFHSIHNYFCLWNNDHDLESLVYVYHLSFDNVAAKRTITFTYSFHGLADGLSSFNALSSIMLTVAAVVADWVRCSGEISLK